ncbi:DUF3828 domain-containing protein [Rhodanobacter sp. L36]|uniref:DUF3828 domain-containing protein n=1 Tax=Rhodanobacter sp. L36 TaxID=1747221 RepID=UPI00131B6A24|nr:DUF3828 domain-containing protein [Rhodanobacter sp. L36]
MKMFATLALCLLFNAGMTMAADAPASRAPNSAAAEKFLRGIYANYHENDKGVPNDVLKDSDVYETSLLALMAADQKAAGDGYVGYMDADPLCDCQDFDIRDVKIGIKPTSKHRLDATVSFRNFGENQTLHLLLLHSPKGWRVFDVMSSEGSLREGLEKDIKLVRH